jgi:hypothetical protein
MDRTKSRMVRMGFHRQVHPFPLKLFAKAGLIDDEDTTLLPCVPSKAATNCHTALPN